MSVTFVAPNVFGWSPVPTVPTGHENKAERPKQETSMLTTIIIAGHVSAQGIKVQDHIDGRVRQIAGVTTSVRRL